MTEFRLNLSSLRDAVDSLDGGLEVVGDSAWFNHQSSKAQKILIAGVIQHFEFVYELSAKMIVRQLKAESASHEERKDINFRDVLRVAARNGLISNVEAWFHYREMRNITSHTYDKEKAQKVYQTILEFIRDAKELLRNLEARNA